MRKLIIVFFFFVILLFFHLKGFVFYDEGYIVSSALRVAQGEIPYRDFDMVYTPLSYVITAGFLKLFGVTIFATRIAALTISLFSIFAIYKIAGFFTKNIFLQITAVLFFIAWGPAHTNFVWPVMFAICFLLYTMFFYLLGVSTKEKKYFFFAGSMSVLVFLSKQNFGTAVFLVALLPFFLHFKKEKHALVYFLFGAVATGAIFIFILLATNSLVPFFQNLYVYTFQRILVQKSLDTPFLYHGGLIEKSLKFLFYTLPFSLSGLAIFFSKDEKNKFWIIPLFCALFYCFGIRPTTDYNHLAPLLSLACLPLVLLIVFAKNKYLQKIFLVLLLALTGLGFYTAYYKEHYKWDYPLSENTILAKASRIHILTTRQNAAEVTSLITYIQSQTEPSEYIFVNYYAPLIYFITDRKNPTKYDFYTSSEMPIALQQDAVTQLQKKQVRLVVMTSFNRNEKSLMADYVKKNFKVRKTIRDWIIFIK